MSLDAAGAADRGAATGTGSRKSSRLRDVLGALESVLKQRLAESLPGSPAQWRFAPTPPRKGWEPHHRPAEARAAAALILLYPGPQGVSFPLTVRRDDLPHHPGQVSLPGGAVDADERPEDAALREAWEEIGVDPATVRLVGPLSTLWVIVSNFVLQPYVAIADARPTFVIETREVAALVEAPLAQLLDPARRRSRRVVRDGILVDYPYFDLEGHQVWGATGMVLSEFVSVLEGVSAPFFGV
jgi:8-oxo-dGTP pyrophosphatase MutT (NUDIX family)